MADWERRITELGVELRDPLPAGGLYTAVVVNGNTAYLSGTVAVEGPPLRLAYAGCLGEDLELADGQASARQAFMALGFSKAQRHELRKELRRTGKVEITFTHVIQRREP